jgi:hypothetical protein
MFLGSEVRPALVEAYPKVESGKAATDRKMWDMQTSDVIIPELCLPNKNKHCCTHNIYTARMILVCKRTLITRLHVLCERQIGASSLAEMKLWLLHLEPTWDADLLF